MAGAGRGAGSGAAAPLPGIPWREALVTIVFIAVVIALVYPGTQPHELRRFDPAEWRSPIGDAKGHSSRYEMVGDLLRRHRLLGARFEEAVAILGAPDQETTNALYPWPSWDLGLGRTPNSSDVVRLVLEVDGEKRVVRVIVPW